MCVLPSISYFQLDMKFETKYVMNVEEKYIFQFLIITELYVRFTIDFLYTILKLYIVSFHVRTT